MARGLPVAAALSQRQLWPPSRRRLDLRQVPCFQTASGAGEHRPLLRVRKHHLHGGRVYRSPRDGKDHDLFPSDLFRGKRRSVRRRADHRALREPHPGRGLTHRRLRPSRHCRHQQRQRSPMPAQSTMPGGYRADSALVVDHLARQTFWTIPDDSSSAPRAVAIAEHLPFAPRVRPIQTLNRGPGCSAAAAESGITNPPVAVDAFLEATRYVDRVAVCDGSEDDQCSQLDRPA